MKYTIYKITNTVNGKIYIGKHQTKDLNDGYMGSGKMLQRAQSKYGIKNFVKEILHVFDTEEEMNAKEAELVTEEFCSREETYNICPGGQGGFGYINTILTDDFRTVRGQNGYKQSLLTVEARYGVKSINYIPAVRSKNIERLKSLHKQRAIKYDNFRNKAHTESSKRKISETMQQRTKGKGNSQYGTMWITDGVSNKKIKTVDTIPNGWYKGRVIKPNS